MPHFRHASIASSKTSIKPLASAPQTSDTLRPWQFFTLGGLICATVAVLIIRGTSAENLIFVCLGIFAAALIGIAVLNTLRPLVTGETREPEMIGSRTRAALEREKSLVLRSIKELEFDHAMGKVSDADYEEMVGRLRSRAVRLLQQLDNTSSGYRELIERELAKRLVAQGFSNAVAAAGTVEPATSIADEIPDLATCGSCGTTNDPDAKFCKNCGTKIVAALIVILAMLTAPVFAQFQMPDPKEMSGIARPVTDLPAGHVSVRVIRGQLSNNVVGHPVEMHVGGKVQTVKTDENGRAEFSGVTPGTTARAVSVVDGERLESQEFPWPSGGGIRLLLVAAAAGGKTTSPAPQPIAGNVVFGDQTRVIIEPSEDSLQVYYLLDIQNTARAPVNPASPVILDMPTGALSTTVLGGAPQAVARGDRVTIMGPFAPGRTSVELAYRMPASDGEATFDQRLPISVPGLAVLMKKSGESALRSPQLPNVQEREFEGERYILAQGPAIAAGSTLTLTVSGLPHHSPLPRWLALGTALVMLGFGFWAASRRPAPAADVARLKQLSSRREKIFGELVRLEQQKRAGAVDAAKYAERRPALIAQLERIYRDLDAAGAAA